MNDVLAGKTILFTRDGKIQMLLMTSFNMYAQAFVYISARAACLSAIYFQDHHYSLGYSPLMFKKLPAEVFSLTGFLLRMCDSKIVFTILVGWMQAALCGYNKCVGRQLGWAGSGTCWHQR